jgi:hypothetical protein
MRAISDHQNITCPICNSPSKQIPFTDSFKEDQDILKDGGWFYTAIDYNPDSESVDGVSMWECSEQEHRFYLMEE